MQRTMVGALPTPGPTPNIRDLGLRRSRLRSPDHSLYVGTSHATSVVHIRPLPVRSPKLWQAVVRAVHRVVSTRCSYYRRCQVHSKRPTSYTLIRRPVRVPPIVK